VSWLAILRGRGPGRRAGGCQGCRHFANDPAVIEAALPGLAILSSAHASVRGGDGLCAHHGRLVDGSMRCALFAGDV
jgi:hypothetical protein